MFLAKFCLVSLVITGASSLWRCGTTTAKTQGTKITTENPICDPNATRPPCHCMEDYILDNTVRPPCTPDVELHEVFRYHHGKDTPKEILVEYGLVGRPKDLTANLTTYEDWKKANLSIILESLRESFCGKPGIDDEAITYEHTFEPVKRYKKLFKPDTEADTMFFQLQAGCGNGNDKDYLVKYDKYYQTPISQGVDKFVICTFSWTEKDFNENVVVKGTNCPTTG